MEEMAISENERGGNRLPTFNRKKIQSEVRVPGGQRERKVQHSQGRTEGRQRSHSREPSFLGEARKKRRIEELEEELKLLKEGNENKDEQHRRRRNRVIRARVKAHIVFLPVRNAAEDQTTNTKGQCLPRGADIIVLRHLPLNTSTIHLEEAPADLILSFFGQNRASEVSS
jgi:hypothetical protein